MERANAAGLTRILLATLLASKLAACQMVGPTAFSAEPLIVDDATARTAVAGYGHVFGRIILIQDGKEKTWSETPGSSPFLVYVRSVRTDELQRVWVTGDGSFYWPLKPGEYLIAGFALGNSSGRVWTTFSVPEPGQAAYIGDLRIVLETTRFAFDVRDEYAEALKRVEPRLSEARIRPAKALMRPEPRLGTYKGLLSACDPAWEIECDRTYRGVTPVLPEDTHDGFPTTASRTPLLEWKPSKAPGVTYDLAIYESLTLVNVLLETRHTLRQRGKLIAYAEGLQEPRFQPKTPLPPGRKYLWSVRLRKGDTVSVWTVSSHFMFFGVGWASSRGQWFGFSTPDK